MTRWRAIVGQHVRAMSSPDWMTLRFALRDRLRLVGERMRFFYAQRVRGFDTPTRPHLDDKTAVWLENQLGKTKLYLEFGSGGSTVLANNLGVASISVESDRFYARAVRRALAHPETARIEVPPMGITAEWGMPLFFRRKKGRRYIAAGFDALDGRFPDFILVDGRYRVGCALESARRAHLAGKTALLMLDDYEGRTFYQLVEDHLGPPDRIGRAALFTIGGTAVSEQAVAQFATDPR